MSPSEPPRPISSDTIRLMLKQQETRDEAARADQSGLPPWRWALREARIVVMGPVGEHEVAEARAARLELVAADGRVPEGLPVHLKLDTGMGRWGVSELPASTRDVVGIMSHLAAAESDPGFSAAQIERFRSATEGLGKLTRHLANSAGTLRYPEARLDAVRCGIALYGISPFAGDPADDDAGELERAVGGDEPQERGAVARREGQPADDAEDQPVEEQREHRSGAREDPAGERGQGDLDVVDHHLRGEARGGLRVEVAALGRVAVLLVARRLLEVVLGDLEALLDTLAALVHRTHGLVRGTILLVLVLRR